MDDRRARLVYLTYRTLGAALQRLPEPAALAAAAVVGEALYRTRPQIRAVRARNMARVLACTSPAVPPDPAVVDRWVRRAFRAYARYWLEGARLPATGRDEVCRRMYVERGYEHLERGMAEGRGVVMVLPHVGSWEWGGAFLAARGYPMTTVAERIEPPELFDWFIRQRGALGLTVVALGGDSGGTVLKVLRSGGLVGLLADRDIEGHGVGVRFFGGATTLPAGPATLALRTGATLVTAAVYSGPGRDHVGVIGPPVDTSRTGSLRADVARVTQELARAMEGLVRRAPEQWHLFQPNWPDDRTAAGDGRGG
ncbi:MAG: phosphatidylinositol mannoside acyltransferase [Acidimicrobiales bacterium]